MDLRFGGNAPLDCAAVILSPTLAVQGTRRAFVSPTVASTLSMVHARMRAPARSHSDRVSVPSHRPRVLGSAWPPAVGRHATPLERLDGTNARETDMERFLEGPTDLGGPGGVF
jgi:hypothetical protein